MNDQLMYLAATKTVAKAGSNPLVILGIVVAILVVVALLIKFVPPLNEKFVDFKDWFIDGLKTGSTSKGPKIILFVIAALFILLAVRVVIWYVTGIAALEAAGK